MAPPSDGEVAPKSVVRKISKQDLPLQTVSVLAQIVASAEPGSRLPTEQELCAQLGIGRSTLREAMRALSFVGAIRVRQGSGAYVSGVEEENIERLITLGLMLHRTKVHELIEARQILEVQAVRIAASNHDASDAEKLTLIMRNMAELASSPTEASLYDLQFHVRLAEATHNGVLVVFIHGLRTLLAMWINKAVDRRQVIEEIISEHNSILHAVLARNGELAAARMTVHMTNAAERLFNVVGRNQSTAEFISLLLNPALEKPDSAPTAGAVPSLKQ